VKPQVDKAFAKEKVPITSPLLRSGNTAAYLRKGAYSPSGTCQLEIFGTYDAKNEELTHSYAASPVRRPR
jgi:hypothetical protein